VLILGVETGISDPSKRVDKNEQSLVHKDQSLAVSKLEEAKYASICGSVLANKEPLMDAGIFDLGLFWVGQKSVLPAHYSL
jgi:hypothetical protein